MEFAKEQVYPALVNIAVVAKGHAAGRSRRFPAAGSGVIVSPAGNGFSEQVFQHNTGTCAGLPLFATAEVPTLDGSALALFVTLLGLAGILVLRRSTS